MSAEEFFDLVTIGEGLVLLNESDSSDIQLGKGFELSTGGAESNVATGLTRLGFKTLWISSVGSDSFGDLVLETLRSQGVRTRVTVDQEAQTGFMLKFKQSQPDPIVLYSRRNSAASRLGRNVEDFRALPITKLFHISGVFAGVSESSFALTMFFVLAARKAGSIISFDINYRPQLWEKAIASERLLRLCKEADLVFGGEEEFALIAGSKNYADSVVEDLAKDSSKEFVVKRAKNGASSLVNGIWFDVKPHRVKMLDSVGAGDAFVAGYLAEVLRNSDPEVRLATANFCGARACESRGDWNGMIYGPELAARRIYPAVARVSEGKA